MHFSNVSFYLFVPKVVGECNVVPSTEKVFPWCFFGSSYGNYFIQCMHLPCPFSNFDIPGNTILQPTCGHIIEKLWINSFILCTSLLNLNIYTLVAEYENNWFCSKCTAQHVCYTMLQATPDGLAYLTLWKRYKSILHFILSIRAVWCCRQWRRSSGFVRFELVFSQVFAVAAQPDCYTFHNPTCSKLFGFKIS